MLILNVNEAFLYAIRWMFHHEIAHISLNHTNLALENSITEEKDADKRATLMILEGKKYQQVSDSTFGIAIALLCLQANETDCFQGLTFNTHPRTFERLYDCLSYGSNLGENDKIYLFCIHIIRMQLQYYYKKDVSLCKEETLESMFCDCLLQFKNIVSMSHNDMR